MRLMHSPLSRLAWFLTSSMLLAQVPSANLKAIRGGLDQLYPSLDALYVDLHEHPELSGKETRTAQKMAEQLQSLGFARQRAHGPHGHRGYDAFGAGPPGREALSV